MLEIANTILPVFIVMAAGYGMVKSGYLKPEISSALNAFTVRFAVPTLLFRAIYNLDFGEAIQWPILLSFYSGALGSFLIATILARTIFKRRSGESVAVGFCAMFSNAVLLGVPIAERAFGLETLALVFGIIAFHAPSLYAIGIVTMEFSRRDGRSFSQTSKLALRSILTNPLIQGVLLGALFNRLSIQIPTMLSTSIDMVATAAIPIALIGIGAALTRYELKSALSETVMVSIISLVIHPLIALAISYYVLGLPTQYVKTAVILAAMPPGMNIYIFAILYNRAVALSASTIVVATSISILTISGWLWILALLPEQ